MTGDNNKERKKLRRLAKEMKIKEKSRKIRQYAIV